MKKVKYMWRILAVRLLLVVCLTFLPLNIMAIAVSGLVIWKTSEQVMDVYQGQLNVSMGYFESSLIKVDEKLDKFILDYQAELMLLDGGDNMVSYEMVNELGDIFTDSEVNGILYLYDCSADRVLVKYSGRTYPVAQVEEMKTELVQEIPQGTNSRWHIGQLDDNYFYLKYYEYTNYKMGFLVDLSNELSPALEVAQGNVQSTEDAHDRQVYFTDGTDLLRLEGGRLAKEAENGDDTDGEWQKQSIKWQSERLGCTVALKLAQGSFLGSIPIWYWGLLIVALLFFLMIFALWGLLQRRVMQPLKRLWEGMEQLKQDNLEYRIENWSDGETADFIYIYKEFNHMAEEIKLSHEKDIIMYQAQLDNLRLQVNPHMLLNSFNMIYSLAQVKDYECIQKFSMYLMEYFRYVLKENDQFVTLKKEMDFVESYIGIQKIRFPGAFTSVYSMQEGTENALIPPLLIENFVENAMKYALVPGQVIEVLINIRKEGDKLLISICDTGKGIREEVLASIQQGEVYEDQAGQKHIGIWNCRRRIEVFYGESASINIISALGEGTQVWLELPFQENV